MKHPPEYWAKRKEERRLRKIEYMRQYNANNRERILEKNREHYRNNGRKKEVLSPEQKERRKLKTAEWRIKNAAAIELKRLQYAKMCRERGDFKTPKILARGARRRARVKNLMHPLHSKEIELEIFKQCQLLNESTGVVHEIDHIIPIKHGGFHHHLNLQILPAVINRKKADKLPWEMEGYKSWRDVPDFLWPDKLKQQFVINPNR
jgi:5-methylcytosine-specific restriction endonuclease McrA